MKSDSRRTTELNNLKGDFAEEFQRMADATVKLTGGMFTGSGVILVTTDVNQRHDTVIATAAHNLWTYINGLSGKVKNPFWTGKLQDQKTDRLALLQSLQAKIISQAIAGTAAPMEVELTGANSSTVKARVTRICMAQWSYDVCLLYVNPNISPKVAIYSTLDDLESVRALFQDYPALYTGELPGEWRLVQAGYGQIHAGNENSKQFKFKVSLLADNYDGIPQAYFDDITGQSQHVIKLQSNKDWTTLQGDSGGPLFALDTQARKILVLGVTLGADVFQQQEDDENAQNDPDGTHNNACTSLFPVHTSWGLNDPIAPPLLDNAFTIQVD